jgi:hypothetical protein
MLKKLCALAAVLLLAGCGGGGGGSSSGSNSGSNSGGSGAGSSSSSGSGGTSSGSGSSSSGALANSVSLTIDQGPAALNTGANAYTSNNVAFVTLTICAPGSTTNCQTIDHVMLDTGSVGLRLIGSVLNSSLLSALPLETDTSSNAVGECYQYIDGYVFGSVRQADLYIGGATPGIGQGEKVSNMSTNVIADPSDSRFSTVPNSCSTAGGTNENTVQAFGANGVIGVGVTTTDVGGLYYDCPSSSGGGCGVDKQITLAASQQVINPVAGMSVDNNGVMIVLPAEPSTGAATATGTLYFGIGTQGNNGLGSAQIYTATTSSSTYGAGYITVSYNNSTLPVSFLDSGSSLYFFDSSITGCTVSGLKGFYCPSSPLNITATISGANKTSGSGNFTLYNAQTQFSSTNAVVPGVGGDPKVLYPNVDLSNSFDYGLPFFYGRTVYTAIEGRNAGGTTGPYFAF